MGTWFAGLPVSKTVVLSYTMLIPKEEKDFANIVVACLRFDGCLHRQQLIITCHLGNTNSIIIPQEICYFLIPLGLAPSQPEFKTGMPLLASRYHEEAAV
jgi:hypothetical protein